MAAPITCDECQQREASFMVTNLDEGQTLAYCPIDFATFALGIALAVIPAEVIYEHLGPVNVTQGGDKPGGGGKGRNRKSTPAEATTEEQATEPASGPDEVETATPNG